MDLLLVILASSYSSAGERAFVGVLTGLFTALVLFLIRYIKNRSENDTPKDRPLSHPSSQSYSQPSSCPTVVDESIYDKLKRLCNPVNFMENYNKEKVEIANQIYSKLMVANPNIDEIAVEAEKLLGIQLVDIHQIEDLKKKLHPKNFMNPYDAQKISLANELYSRIVDNMTYSEYNKLKNEAKTILYFGAKKEDEESQIIKKEIREKREKERTEKMRSETEKEPLVFFYIKFLGLMGLLVLLIMWTASNL